MNPGGIRQKVAEYYTEKLRQFGPTARGADWNSESSQTLRFEVLLRLIDPALPLTVNDYGCGYGAFVDYLQARQLSFWYTGYDPSVAMITQARQIHGGTSNCRFVSDEIQLSPADYTIASGIFNVKLDTPEEEWKDYITWTIDRISELSHAGFGFNVLSSYSHREKRRAHLYYADPLYWFHYCKQNLSPFVALFHDYPLYEFTLWVKK
jgi:SAM-dependent methyltransferase